MSNRFTAVFRSPCHKMALILFTLRKLTLCFGWLGLQYINYP